VALSQPRLKGGISPVNAEGLYEPLKDQARDQKPQTLRPSPAESGGLAGSVVILVLVALGHC
jgi:hypothetical protein